MNLVLNIQGSVLHNYDIVVRKVVDLSRVENVL